MPSQTRTPFPVALCLVLALLLVSCSSPFNDDSEDNDALAQQDSTVTAPAVQSDGTATQEPDGVDETPENVASPTSVDEAIPADPEEAEGTQESEADFRDAIEQVTEMVRPAVAFIAVTQETPGAFGQGQLQQGVGSGVLFDSEEGYILTNNHVVADADSIMVILPDGRRFEGTVLGRSLNPDVALVQIEGEDLPEAVLGDGEDLQIGEWVVAIGNALGLPGGPTVTAGVVGALDRILQAEQNAPPMENLIQTDAAINPGNSGGPLVNLDGEVVGINTAGILGSENLGFAVSINDARDVIEEILEGEPRAVLGITGAPVTPIVAARYGLAVEEGVLVVNVESGSGAEEAGLQPGDVIVNIEGQAVTSASDLGELLDEMSPGDVVTVAINRGGQEEQLDVTLGESLLVQ